MVGRAKEAARRALIGATLIVVAGCGDECEQGATRCLNNAVQACTGVQTENGWDSTPGWRTNTCFHATCVAAPGRPAMCVPLTEPDPLCAGVDSYCSGDTAVFCSGGDRVSSEACAATLYPEWSHCAAIGPTAVACLPPEAMPNVACPPFGTAAAMELTPVCDANVFTYCWGGLAAETAACGTCAANRSPPCTGFLGDACTADAQCASGFTCHPDSTGTDRCTAACDAADPSAAQACEDLYVAGGPPGSNLTRLYVGTPGDRMACRAGFCEWTD